MALIMPTPSPAPTKFTTICQGWKLASSRAAATQPRNREEYTSLLMRASAIATTGGEQGPAGSYKARAIIGDLGNDQSDYDHRQRNKIRYLGAFLFH